MGDIIKDNFKKIRRIKYITKTQTKQLTVNIKHFRYKHDIAFITWYNIINIKK